MHLRSFVKYVDNHVTARCAGRNGYDDLYVVPTCDRCLHVMECNRAGDRRTLQRRAETTANNCYHRSHRAMVRGQMVNGWPFNQPSAESVNQRIVCVFRVLAAEIMLEVMHLYLVSEFVNHDGLSRPLTITRIVIWPNGNVVPLSIVLTEKGAVVINHEFRKGRYARNGSVVGIG